MLLAAFPAAANDAQLVADMAAKCWTLPEETDYQRASATFEVTYNAEGELVRIVTVEYQPVRRAGREFAISAQQALNECATNTPVRSRTVRVVYGSIIGRAVDNEETSPVARQYSHERHGVLHLA
ncbi:hypothetical protein [Brucella tritici]|uniref:hypothetical protein n=1 Tax=Brucella tritici TaxID=94626 RepID=UPI001F38FE7F|nr:hypothetical protein [Brucella tritici]